ncbi:MAG: hypothetical protein NVSMB8_08310 [Candidatus Limnocylindrales bacterium]
MTIRRIALAVVLAVAAASAALAGSGLAAPPHAHAPGTPAAHDHVLAAYRYPLFLLRLRALALPASGPQWSLDLPAGGAAAALVFALLTALVPRLPRPTRRPLAAFAVPALAQPVGRAARILAPPRPATLLLA